MRLHFLPIAPSVVLLVASAAAQVTGSGASGTIPVFTGSSTIGNSPIIVSGGNVGIGTTSPATTFVVSSSQGSTNSTYAMSVTNTPQSNGWGVGIANITNTTNVSNSLSVGQYVSGAGNFGSAFNSSYMGFVNAGGNGSMSNLGTLGISGKDFIINWNGLGNVGIGTTNPGATLEVNGSVKLTSGSGASMTFADGTAQTTAWTGVLCGGDYAESVDVTGDRTHYEPGDVLVADPDHDGKFLKSAAAYSTGVLGVYSTKPGAVGRRQTTSKSADEVPMAMIGIVPTKVSAENGAVKPGDLLVTATTPGYAMKGTDRSLLVGAVIGKALGHLEAGKGVIEVGVTLQ